MTILGVVLVLLTAYVGSYWGMSRHGFAMADEYDFQGFYFYVPEDSDQWRWAESGTRLLYLPLIYVDNWIGTGRWPASEPLWQLGWLGRGAPNLT